MARSGVLEYSDGQRTWREYRPPEEVFAEDSLATLRGAVVTDMHPPKLVTPETYASVARGHADGAARRDGDLLVTDMMVQEAGLCRAIEAGERRELSCGYTCEVERTPGVTPEGEHYDAIQRRIRHNHIALLPPGEGRSGPEVSLRLDGAAVEVSAGTSAAKGNPSMKKIKIKGREIKLDAAEDEAAAQSAVDEVQKKADADASELAAVKGALMDALQKVAAMEAKMAAASAATPAAVTEDMVPEEVQDAIASKRGALLTSARKVLGPEVKLDGLKATEIHQRVVAKAHPSMKLDGLSADTIRGMYEVVVAPASERNDALSAARAPLGHQPPSTRTDADDATPLGLARRTSEAWRTSKPTYSAAGSR